MNAEQIKKYEYCSQYLEKLRKWKNEIPFSYQQYGCGSRAPAVEHQLQFLHIEMYEAVHKIIDDTIKKLEERIEAI